MPFIKQLQSRVNLNLLLIILLAIVLRVVLLADVPNGFHQDEAINGYDAYSILKTGKDEYGVFLPLFVRSLNDYRESLHIFLLIPFIKVFGLTEFAIRATSATIGILTVLTVYFLAKELFDQRAGLLAALFLAISPWHIQFSRIGYGAILVPFCFCLGLLFLVKSLKQPNFLYLSALGFGFGLYTYASARVFVSLFLIGAIIIYWKHLWQHKKQTAIATVIFLVIFAILLQFWISPEGMARAKFVGLVKDPVQLLQNYLSYFSPNFLFFSGDPHLRHNPNGIGELQWIELLTVPAGLFFLLRTKGHQRSILLLWLLLYPIPAALTEPSHALRAIGGSPIFAILSGYGLFKLAELLKLKPKQLALVTLFLTVISTSIFWKFYFIEYPKDSTYNSWRYGMKEAITYAEKNSNDVIISNAFHHTHTFILFYTQYDPTTYQRSPLNSNITFQNQGSYVLGKYHIVPISEQLQPTPDQLLILMPQEAKKLEQSGHVLNTIRTIKTPRGKAEIQLVQVQKNP